MTKRFPSAFCLTSFQFEGAYPANSSFFFKLFLYSFSAFTIFPSIKISLSDFSLFFAGLEPFLLKPLPVNAIVKVSKKKNIAVSSRHGISKISSKVLPIPFFSLFIGFSI